MTVTCFFADGFDGGSSRWKKMLLLACLSSLLVHPSDANSFVILARQSTNFLMDAILDIGSRKMILTGFQFRPAHAEITAAGQADTQCMTSIGDVRGFDARFHDSPQLCVNVVGFPFGSGIPYGIVAGVAGRQSTLYQMPFLGDYDETPLLEPMNLPIETYPVSLATDAQAGVYVGLHDTGGNLVHPLPTGAAVGAPTGGGSANTNNQGSILQGLIDYFKLFTTPKSAIVTSPVVMKVNMTTSKVIWQTKLETERGQSLIGAMVHLRSLNLIAVAGSSNGSGSSVGAGVASNDWDGYLTLMDATSGEIDDSNAEFTHLTATHSLRISSQIGQDDFVYGICAKENYVYLVGATTGNMDDEPTTTPGGGAFVMKIDVTTLNISWKQQLHGAGAVGLECEVRGGNMFVGGHVPAGVLMEQDDSRTKPSPNQDILAVAMDEETGDVKWVRQIDSRRQDILINAVISSNGDLFVMANAFDEASGQNDAFLMTVTTQGGTHDWMGLPEDVDPISSAVGKTTIDDDEASPPNVEENNDDDNKTAIIVAAVVIPVVLLLGVAIYAVSSAKKNNESNNNNIANAGQEGPITVEGTKTTATTTDMEGQMT